MKISRTALEQAALAAAFSAGFNSDWAQAQLEKLKNQINSGGMRPYVPWVIGAGLVWYLTKGGR